MQQQVGRYQILGELGRGAMGVVYKALDPAIGRTIAIKSIRLTDLTDEAERRRLRDLLFREARSAGILSHPNIVTIYDIAEEGDRAYIFMEFVSGPPLEKLMASPQGLQPDSLLNIFRQTAAALDYAHGKGIVHRDIKPTNILIHDDGAAKVTDFGVAKILSQNMSLPGGIMGTPSYMPPEQIQGETAALDGRADQFSLAVVVYEALTGEKPFVAEHLPTLLFKIVRDDFVAPQRLNPTLGPRVETVVRRAMAKNAAERYTSCGEFIGALSAACRMAPGWTPLPRSASQNMPTVGSMQAAPTEKTAAAAPLPPNWPPPRDPRARHEPSHLARNVMLMAAALTAVCAGAFFVLRTSAVSTAETQVAQNPSPQDQTPPSTRPQETQPSVPQAPPPSGQVAPEQTPPERAESSIPQAPPHAAPAVSHATPPPPAESEFELTVMPPGSVAIFDNDPQLRCVAPCSITLARGRHTFTVSSNGYREEHRIIEIPQDPGLIVNLEKASGMLSVTSTPSGLAVAIDGQVQTRRTPAIFSLSPGQHRVELERGSERRVSVVEIHDGATFSLSVDWPR